MIHPDHFTLNDWINLLELKEQSKPNDNKTTERQDLKWKAFSNSH